MSTAIFWLLLVLLVFALLAWRGVRHTTAILIAVLATTSVWLVWWLAPLLLAYVTLD